MNNMPIYPSQGTILSTCYALSPWNSINSSNNFIFCRDAYFFVIGKV